MKTFLKILCWIKKKVLIDVQSFQCASWGETRNYSIFEFNFLFVQLCSWQCQNDKHSFVYVEFTLRMWPLFFGCSSTSSSMQFNRQRKSLTLTTNGDIICSPMTYIDCYTRLLRIVPALESPKSTSVVS